MSKKIFFTLCVITDRRVCSVERWVRPTLKEIQDILYEEYEWMVDLNGAIFIEKRSFNKKGKDVYDLGDISCCVDDIQNIENIEDMKKNKMIKKLFKIPKKIIEKYKNHTIMSWDELNIIYICKKCNMTYSEVIKKCKCGGDTYDIEDEYSM